MSSAVAQTWDEARPEIARKAMFGLLIVAFANGMYARINLAIAAAGFWDAAFGTFGISVIIWLAMWMALEWARGIEIGVPSRMDYLFFFFAAISVVLPVSGVTWIGLTALSGYLLVTKRGNFTIRRLFWVVLALSFSSFWSRLMFRFFMDYILRMDTLFVALLTRTSSDGNLITAADGATTLQVLEGCSSFNNMSLAFLAWILARSYYGTTGLWRSIGFVALSCFFVVFINTVRIGIIALDPKLYELAHGPFGANIANLLISAAVATVSIVGARR